MPRIEATGTISWCVRQVETDAEVGAGEMIATVYWPAGLRHRRGGALLCGAIVAVVCVGGALSPAAATDSVDLMREPLKLVWEYRFRSGSDVNAPYALAVESDGSVYVAGDVGSGADWRVVKLDANGREVWRDDRAEPGLEIAYGLVATTTGGVVAAGMQTAVQHDVLVLALSGNGRPGWQYAPQEAGDQTCYGLASDRHGNLYLAGETTGRWEVRSLRPGRPRALGSAGPKRRRARSRHAQGRGARRRQ